MDKKATISECGRFRYRLGRRWSDGPTLLFVMLNPSTADADIDDPTIRRCIGFGRSHVFGAIEVVNLYAWRATDPADLRRHAWPVGPDNDQHIQAAVEASDRVCVAWGASAGESPRPGEVLPVIRGAGRHPFCLGVTRSGHPSHPLYRPAMSILLPFTLDLIDASRG
jgi:hypothetical protein